MCLQRGLVWCTVLLRGYTSCCRTALGVIKKTQLSADLFGVSLLFRPRLISWLYVYDLYCMCCQNEPTRRLVPECCRHSFYPAGNRLQ